MHAEFRFHSICEVFTRARNSASMIFARFSRARNSASMIFAVLSSAQMSVTMLFAVFSSAQMSVTMLFAVFPSAQMSVTMLFAVFSSAQMSVTMLFAVFSHAQGVRGVLRLYYKSRLSSHGSSGCPRRTTFVLQKSTFQPRKLRVSPAHYVCTTKVDFPATEAPGVRSVPLLYYKSRLSSHGSSGRPRRTTCVLQKSTFQPRKSPAYYVCTTKAEKNAKTRRFWHRDHAKTRRGVTFVCQETQKHDGFGTATTRKPAEGLRLYVKKRKNTTVLAPRQRRNPQRVVCAHEKGCNPDWRCQTSPPP